MHPLTEWTISAFGFPAKAGTHLATPEGWKAELALGGQDKVDKGWTNQQLIMWLIVKKFND